MKHKTVKEIMTTQLFTASEDWSLDQLADFLVANNVTGAPVTSAAGEVVGVVSMTDIVRYQSLPLLSSSPHDTHEYYMSEMGRQYSPEEIESFRLDSGEQATVSDVMTPMVFSINEDASVQQVADMMITGNIHRVLVMKNKQVVGLVAALDIARVIRDM